MFACIFTRTNYDTKGKHMQKLNTAGVEPEIETVRRGGTGHVGCPQVLK